MISLCDLPLTVRVLFSSFLIMIGIGYLMALSYLFLVDVKPGRDVGERAVESISEKYHGSTSGTRLEAALKGTMADRLTAEERDRVFQWIRAGATRDGYAKIDPLFKQKCATCHSAQSGMPIPPLTSFEDVQKVTTIDTGESLLQLARVSHIHLFGISIIFLLTRSDLQLKCDTRLVSCVCSDRSLPGNCYGYRIMVTTKYYNPVFAYIVILGGALMGLALACQIFVSLWDMCIVPLTASAQAKSPKDKPAVT